MTENNSTAFKMLKEILDEQQIKAVQIDKNAVVAAGAGSGKTRVLAFRFAYLVAVRKIPVDKILTLTFTDKAASEMYGRIYATLKNLSQHKDQDETTRLAQKAVENFHTARIQTLDSYCASLVKRGGRFFGISPDFVTDPDKARDFAQKRAIPFILKHRTNPSLQQFIGTSKIEKTAQELFASVMVNHTSIAVPISFENLFNRQKDEVVNQYKILTSKISSLALEAAQLFTEIPVSEHSKSSFTDLEKALTSNKSDISFPEHARLVQYMSAQDSAFEQDLTRSMNGVYILKKVSVKASKYPFDLIKPCIEQIRLHYDELSGICSFILNYRVIRDIMMLLDEFQGEYNDAKRMSGILTFKDVSDLALEILKTNYDIRETEKLSAEAIMIDEFQDDNEQQRDMLFFLAEKEASELGKDMSPSIPRIDDLCPGKLFFVGDEKQSIYRFRGADVEVFRSLRNIFDSSVTLSTNFRSSPSLVSSFNSLFGGSDYPFSPNEVNTELPIRTQRSSIFIKKEHLAEGIEYPPFEAEYTPIQCNGDKLDGLKSLHSAVTICLYDSEEAGGTEDSESGETETEIQEPVHKEAEEEFLDAKETLAFFTAQKIKTLIESSNGTYTYASCAVLFRTYTNQYYYEKYLRSFGIPYISESIQSFFSDAPVNDIFSLLRLIIFPKDTSSYASVLHSPFVHLGQNGVHICLAHWNEKSLPFDTETENFLETADKYFYRKGRELYTRLCSAAKSSNVCGLITRIWYTEGYRFETLWNNEVSQYGELYDFLFELARRIDSEGKTLSSFIDILDELQNNDSALTGMDIPLERSGAVRLMSIHKSKGLEFPVVFVCGLSDKGKNDTNNEAVFFDKEFGVCLNLESSSSIPDCKANYFFTRSREKENVMRDAELRRLLYVAMTRAVDLLFLTSVISVPKSAQKFLKTTDDYGNQLNKFESSIAALQNAMTHKKSDSSNANITPLFCIPQNNFSSLLFPAMHGFIEQTEPASGAVCRPFIIEEIPQYTKSGVSALHSKSIAADKLAVQNLVHPLYMSIPEKSDHSEQDFHINPSSLHTGKGNTEQGTDIEYGRGQKYSAIDDIIASMKDLRFGYEDFGTIAHSYAESIFTGLPVTLPGKITSVLSEKQLETVTHSAFKMAADFLQTELGQKAKNASWRKNEYAFKMRIENTDKTSHRIITGSIDLAFRFNGVFYLVDFKTDTTQDISRHCAQLALYRKALSSLKQCREDDIQCCLHYLRTNTSADITAQIKTIRLEDLLFL